MPNADRKYFGIDSRNSFSLKNRLLARLVEKLAGMDFERDKEDAGFYQFSKDGQPFLFARIETKEWEEGHFRSVQIIGEDGEVVLTEDIFPDGIGNNYAYHPLSELFELARTVDNGSVKELQESRVITSLLE